MRVLIAPDGFGGTLSPAEAAQAIADGWASVAPRDQVDLAPLSDGGPGLVEVLAAALPDAQVREAVVEDPLGRPVPARWLLDGATAYVESAQACGLHLLTAEERDPTRTSTYGVGQLLRAAADAGAERIVVGLGGSGTNEGGAGMLSALGLQRFDADGRAGAALRAVVRLAGPPKLPPLVAATDVDAPLLGLRGASAVFGPQKGATREQVALLDGALTQWADVLEAHLGVAVRDLPGAGAAGGLGAALLALGAVREPGIALVQRLVGLAERVAQADLVVTGEGTFDVSSLRGKVVSGVAAAAAEEAVPCLVLAGRVTVGRREVAAAGVEAAYQVPDLEASLAHPARELAALAARVGREWSRGVGE
ncbi:MAG: hypothetical protein JWN77_2305 [Frankiales bacterium]|nr:hypothetical protein [Frankiales bacterium]